MFHAKVLFFLGVAVIVAAFPSKNIPQGCAGDITTLSSEEAQETLQGTLNNMADQGLICYKIRKILSGTRQLASGYHQDGLNIGNYSGYVYNITALVIDGDNQVKNCTFKIWGNNSVNTNCPIFKPPTPLTPEAALKELQSALNTLDASGSHYKIEKVLSGTRQSLNPKQPTYGYNYEFDAMLINSQNQVENCKVRVMVIPSIAFAFGPDVSCY